MRAEGRWNLLFATRGNGFQTDGSPFLRCVGTVRWGSTHARCGDKAGLTLTGRKHFDVAKKYVLTQKSERFDSLYTWREGYSQVMNRLVVFLVLVAFLALRLNEAKACKCRRCCWELPILSWLHAGTQTRNLELIRSWHGDPEIGLCMKQILRFPCCFLTHVPTLEILKSFHFLGKRHPRLICREHATKVLGGKKALNKPW